jgi:hypothetical protein
LPPSWGIILVNAVAYPNAHNGHAQKKTNHQINLEGKLLIIFFWLLAAAMAFLTYMKIKLL